MKILENILTQKSGIIATFKKERKMNKYKTPLEFVEKADKIIISNELDKQYLIIRQKDKRIAELEKQLAIRDNALILLVLETKLCHENGVIGIIGCYLEKAEEALKKADGK